MGKALGARAGLDGSSRGVDTEGRKFGLRDLALVLLAGTRAPPMHGWGLCLVAAVAATWIAIPSPRRRGSAGPPTIEIPRGADPGGPLPSGPVPTPSLRSWRTAGSSPAGTAPVRPPHPLSPGSPDVSQAACTSPGTPHDDAIPVDRVSSSCARAPSEVTSMILARDPGRADADLIEWPMNRVASAEAGRQPFPPLRAHDDAVRSTLRALHEETAVSRRGESGHQRRRPSCNGTVWR